MCHMRYKINISKIWLNDWKVNMFVVWMKFYLSIWIFSCIIRLNTTLSVSNFERDGDHWGLTQGEKKDLVGNIWFKRGCLLLLDQHFLAFKDQFHTSQARTCPLCGFVLRGTDTTLTLVSIVFLKLCVPMNLVEHHLILSLCWTA